MKRRMWAIVGLTVVAVAGSLVAAAPAQAVLGTQVVEATSVSDSVAIKSVTANCPAGGVVYGGGGYLIGGVAHNVRLSGLRPVVNLVGLSGFRVTATEDESGHAGDWAVRAFAVCGPKLPGYQVVWLPSPNTSDFSKSATATCPNGKKVISAGADIVNGGADAVLQLIVPSNNLDWVTVNAYEDETGYPGNWQLIAYAVCANSLQGLELVVATSPVDEGAYKFAFVECPDGKELLGLGGHAFGGVPSFGELFLNAVYGFQGDPWSAVVHGWEDETGFATGWFVGAYAICAY